MADCREQVYSDRIFDFIVSYEETNEQTIAGTCIQRIDEGYDIFIIQGRDCLRLV